MRGTKSAVKSLENLIASVETEVNKSIQNEMQNLRQRMRSKLVKKNSIASGELYRNIEIRGPRRTMGIYRHSIESLAPHSGFVEFGTGGHNIATDPKYKYDAPERVTRMMTAEIYTWMIMKQVQPNFGDFGQSAYLIARSIAKYPETEHIPGTKAKPFFYISMWEHEYLFRQSARNAVKRGVRKA